MKNNISKLKNCYGCGVCVTACPVKIISLKENNDGFYQPEIVNQDKCIECERCLKVCAFNDKDVVQDLSYNPKAFAAWSNDAIVRQRCSSGGFGFEIGRHLIEKGYMAIGVKYDIYTNRAEHYEALSIEEFQYSIGSKYIQSFTSNAFNKIDLKQKYLITGTPCQIDSIRRYLRLHNKENNFVLLDFFCHGVPSLLLWDKYVNKIESQLGKTTFISWRNKTHGWHDSWSMEAETDEEFAKGFLGYDINENEKIHTFSSRRSDGDLFYYFFLGNYCLNRCCYSACKYKMLNSAADIRIGDFWGKQYKNDEKGVSAALALTPKGENVLKGLLTSCSLIPHSIDEACQGQMKNNASTPPIYERIITALQGSMTLEEIKNSIIKPYRRRFLLGRIGNRILRIMKFKPIFRTQ